MKAKARTNGAPWLSSHEPTSPLAHLPLYSNSPRSPAGRRRPGSPGSRMLSDGRRGSACRRVQDAGLHHGRTRHDLRRCSASDGRLTRSWGPGLSVRKATGRTHPRGNPSSVEAFNERERLLVHVKRQLEDVARECTQV